MTDVDIQPRVQRVEGPQAFRSEKGLEPEWMRDLQRVQAPLSGRSVFKSSRTVRSRGLNPSGPSPRARRGSCPSGLSLAPLGGTYERHERTSYPRVGPECEMVTPSGSIESPRLRR